MDRDILKPTTLDEFEGQPEVVKKLKLIIAEAKGTGSNLPHILLVSDPGMGKTTLARLISVELDGEAECLEEVDLSMAKPAQFAKTLLFCEKPIVFLDEVHRAKPAQQEMCLKWLEEGIIVMPSGGEEDVSYLSAIAATTEEEKLKSNFLSRFPIKLTLRPYDEDTLTLMIWAMAERLKLALPDDMGIALAKAALGCPRTARDLLLAYRTVAYAGDASIKDVLQFTDLEPDGLQARHMLYLAKVRQYGPVGERQLSSVTRMHVSVLWTVENALLERGYINLTPQGRDLTKEGRARVEVMGRMKRAS